MHIKVAVLWKIQHWMTTAPKKRSCMLLIIVIMIIIAIIKDHNCHITIVIIVISIISIITSDWWWQWLHWRTAKHRGRDRVGGRIAFVLSSSSSLSWTSTPVIESIYALLSWLSPSSSFTIVTSQIYKDTKYYLWVLQKFTIMIPFRSKIRRELNIFTADF